MPIPRGPQRMINFSKLSVFLAKLKLPDDLLRKWPSCILGLVAHIKLGFSSNYQLFVQPNFAMQSH